MSRFFTPLLILGCLMSLLLACFSNALFRDQQFSYRDAAHYYYPLYQKVQQEWEAGRWPLWETEENGGMPLLGKPDRRGSLPGEVALCDLPLCLGARLYVIAYGARLRGDARLDAVLEYELDRSATLSALELCVRAPILFQYCNIIFLVGAAWTPLGFHAADRWLETRRAHGAARTGGGPCLANAGRGSARPATSPGSARSATPSLWPGSSPAQPRGIRGRDGPGCSWFWPVLASLPMWHSSWFWQRSCRRIESGTSSLPLVWMPWAPTVVLAIWCFLGAVLVVRWGRRGRVSPPGSDDRRAGVCGGSRRSPSPRQLLPVLEYTRQSSRAAGGGPHDIYPFSLEPLRLFELVWPNLYGSNFSGNNHWMPLIPYLSQHAHVWVPSLYMGGFTLILALRRVRLSEWPAVAWLALRHRFDQPGGEPGEFSSPLWWARQIPARTESLGPLDPEMVGGLRDDGMLRDGDGGVYWLLSTLLPGFRQFRYPSKL